MTKRAVTARTLKTQLRDAKAQAAALRHARFKAKLALRDTLTFSKNNAKVTGHIISLPAGHACVFANTCLAFAHRDTGKITDGENAIVRCFAATGESWASNARAIHWHNFDLLRACRTAPEMVALIARSLPQDAQLVRIHAAGDYFNQRYFDAWLEIARALPGVTFYSYTKALPFWINRLHCIPSNFHLTASKGGTHDHLIALHNLRYAEVFNYAREARAAGLPIDHDDTHAWKTPGSFALLIHGTQRAGSVQAKAWSVQRAAKRKAKLRAAAKAAAAAAA